MATTRSGLATIFQRLRRNSRSQTTGGSQDCHQQAAAESDVGTRGSLREACLRGPLAARLKRGCNEEEELATRRTQLDRQRNGLGVRNQSPSTARTTLPAVTRAGRPSGSGSGNPHDAWSAQASTRTSTVNGRSPRSGSGMTRGPGAAPSSGDSASSTTAAPVSVWARIRHRLPRARTSAPIGSSRRVERCSTSPSGNLNVRIGVSAIARGYPDR
jgi:hypothetical protein